MDADSGERERRKHYDRVSESMEAILGPQHDTVSHALIPYAVGGALDLYYYPDGVPGTGIATKELSENLDECSTSDVFKTYELVMFTRHPIDLDAADDDETPFGAIHSNIGAILNVMAPYSAQATLNPHETCEFPADMENLGGKCLVFDAYGNNEFDTQHEFGLLLLIEVFRSEMEFAREEGGAALLERLKLAGHYPYSDLDRKPVA